MVFGFDMIESFCTVFSGGGLVMGRNEDGLG